MVGVIDLVADRAGSFTAEMEREIAGIDSATIAALRVASTGARDDIRGLTRAAGLGNRLPRTWRSRVYANHQSGQPAALIWTRAPHIMTAFIRGATIRSRNGAWLAIPTAAILKRAAGGKRMTPAIAERIYGQRLRVVYRRGAPALLVLDTVRPPT